LQGRSNRPARKGARRTADDTLLLRHPRFSDVREETGMGSAALGVVHSGFVEA
jgi:hypothetical protein